MVRFYESPTFVADITLLTESNNYEKNLTFHLAITGYG
jgi:hypothetical protein